MQFFELEDETVWGATARILTGFLAQVLWAPGPQRVREHMEQTRNLPAFCERIKRAFYGGQQS